jgi:radical SAM superfamily enzyme YgiQ (UPF0313 family)
MLASVFQEHEVKIIDCIAEGLTYKDAYHRMKEFAPSWVIINPITCIFVHDCIIAYYAKTLGAQTVVISPHSKALKEEVRERFKGCIDHILDYSKGGLEPEWALKKLITGELPRHHSFKDLPSARQDLLPLSRYSLPFIGSGFTFVTISRGCPYKCIYCRQAVMYEGQVRYRSVDSVVEEIRRYDLKNIALHSDTATLDKEWMYEFCNKVPKDVRWICNSRVDTVTPDLLSRMRWAGCWMVCYGIESGDDGVLAKNKKGATCEQAKEAVKWAKEAGLKVWGYFMLGLEGDTKSTMERTIKFAKSLPIDIANFAVSSPYPGTEWNARATKAGWLDPKADWEDFDQNHRAIVEQPDCSSALVKRMQRRAYIEWYLSIRGMKLLWNNLKHIGFFWNALSDHIRSIA